MSFGRWWTKGWREGTFKRGEAPIGSTRQRSRFVAFASARRVVELDFEKACTFSTIVCARRVSWLLLAMVVGSETMCSNPASCFDSSYSYRLMTLANFWRNCTRK